MTAAISIHYPCGMYVVPCASKLGFLLLLIACSVPGLGAEPVIFEGFEDLDNWEPLVFKKIDRQSRYRTRDLEGIQVLEISSQGSASAIVSHSVFNVYEDPHIRWRWKCVILPEGADPREKKGDDYAIRVYVVFEYNPEDAGFLERSRYALAKAFYGEYPPHSSLNYVWSNQFMDLFSFPNPYTDKAMMIPLDHGLTRKGEWRVQERNILEDYRRAFWKEPPARASIAIMGDSDNTGSRTLSYIDYISVGPEPR